MHTSHKILLILFILTSLLAFVSATSVCGNGIVEEHEQCDGNDLGGRSCESLDLGLNYGTLGCNADCTYDMNACTSVAPPEKPLNPTEPPLPTPVMQPKKTDTNALDANNTPQIPVVVPTPAVPFAFVIPQEAVLILFIFICIVLVFVAFKQIKKDF